MLQQSARSLLGAGLPALPAAWHGWQLCQASYSVQAASVVANETTSGSLEGGRGVSEVPVDSSLEASTSGSAPGLDPSRPQLLPRLLTKVEPKPMALREALQHVADAARSRARFDETIEAHFRLKVDPRRGDQMVRSAAVLPHSIGKPVRICVFAEGAAAEEARAAGADLVGDATLVASILESKGKEIDFNRCLAHPDMMKYLVVLGKILGPKGLMPNPKVGTLTAALGPAIAATRRGRLEFKMDRAAIVHVPIGKASFPVEHLYDNAAAMLRALLAAKPEVIKGGLPKYLRRLDVASTQGRGVQVDAATLQAAVDAAGAAEGQQ